MNIYSNSFFHRVREYSVVTQILQEGFKAFYCKEEIYRGKGVPPTSIGIPMVSFCDIPLSHITKNNYGNCGIAMSRRWGISHHLEPVLYYPNDTKCQSTKMIIAAADIFLQDRDNNEAYRILGYAKPVKKNLRIKGKSSDNYVEREWRKVYANPSPLKWKTEAEYNIYRGDKAAPKQPVGTPLGFDINDIDFILIDKSNLNNLCHFIMGELNCIGGHLEHKLKDEDRYALLSKILVYENLVNNL